MQKNPPKWTNGEIVTQYRKLYGWTQAELAAMCKIAKLTIIRTENNQADPSYKTLAALANCFNIEIGHLTNPKHYHQSIISIEGDKFVFASDPTEQAQVETEQQPANRCTCGQELAHWYLQDSPGALDGSGKGLYFEDPANGQPTEDVYANDTLDISRMLGARNTPQVHDIKNGDGTIRSHGQHPAQVEKIPTYGTSYSDGRPNVYHYDEPPAQVEEEPATASTSTTKKKGTKKK